MNRIYISEESDPYFNVAAEYQLFTETGPETCLFLWQNRPAVILGRNQNVFAECDMAFLRGHGIPPVRRLSGGGTVFHDLGNVNFTFLAREEDANMDRYLKVVHDAVSSLGVECTFSGRNDLLAGGKKFSGHAHYTDDGHFLYHGTLMVSVDLDMLAGALKPSFIKLRSRGIDSVRSRVVNLSDLCADITPQKMKDAMAQAFLAEYATEPSAFPINKRTIRPSILEKIQKADWIYGEAPDFDVSFEKKLSFGNVCISADISNGRITRIKIHTDSLAVLDFTSYEKELLGSFFDEGTLISHLEQFVKNVKR